MKRTDAQKRADKAYNKKSITISICYRPAEIAEGLRLKAYLAQTGKSANAYIKNLIQDDLDMMNIPYPDNADDNDNTDNTDNINNDNDSL